MPDNSGTAFGIIQERQQEAGGVGLPQEGMNQALEPDRLKLAKEVEEYFVFYQTKLQTPYQNMVRWTRLFLNEVKDRRGADELWRAFVPNPYPWSVIKTLAASFGDLVLGQNPVITPRAQSAANAMPAQNIERLFDFVFRRIKFSAELKRFIEEMGIQGVACRKNTLVVKEKQVFRHPDPDKEQEFMEAIANATQEGIEVPDLNNAEAFENWRQLANEEVGLGIPEMPIPGPKTVRSYYGPGFLRTSIYDMLYDPNIPDFDDQPIIIQRAIKPLSWLMDRTGLEPDKLFDPVAVEEGKNGAGTNDVNQWQTEILEMYGLTSDDTANPRMKNAVEIWEAWFPKAKQHPYRVVLNRKIVINKNMDNPYAHGNHPYIFARNNTVSGTAIGISEFKVVERLFYEMNTFRSLRLDALLLSVLPIFIKAKDAGMPQIDRLLKPGHVFSTNRPDALQQLVKQSVDPAIFQEDGAIKSDINEATGTLPVLRGQPSLPRVPAAANERSFQTTFTRIKDRVVEFEGELNPFITNSLFIMYQFWPVEKIVRVGGNPKMNPFVTYNREDFVEAIEADYQFNGTRTAFNNEKFIQDAKEWFTVLAGVSELIPTLKLDSMAQKVTEMVFKDAASGFFLSEEELQQIQEQQRDAEESEDAEGEGEGAPQEQAPEGPPTEEQPE
jgi:hypothetical protein